MIFGKGMKPKEQIAEVYVSQTFSSIYEDSLVRPGQAGSLNLTKWIYAKGKVRSYFSLELAN